MDFVDEKIVLRPLKHGRQKGPEKNSIMVRVFYAFNHWFKYPEHELRKIARIISAAYDILITLDDVQDDAILRKGTPCSYLIYGNLATVYSNLYALNVALADLSQFENLNMVDTMIECGLDLFVGLNMENTFRVKCLCPTEDQYFDIVTNKAALPIGMLVKFLQILCDCSTNFERLILYLSYFFQLANDYSSFHCLHYATRKTFCDDLTAGVFSYPIVCAINMHPEDQEIFEIFKERTHNIEKKLYFIKLLHKYGVFGKCKSKIAEIQNIVFEEIEMLGGNSEMMGILDNYSKGIDSEAFFDYTD